MISPAITHTNIQIHGDVKIHPDAVIAPGVVLQATEGSHIVIAAGVCIGSATIIQAHQGNIEIAPHVVIGASCLVIGQCDIGENTCVGHRSTILSSSLTPETILAANSLIGDTSRPECSVNEDHSSAATTSRMQDPWHGDPQGSKSIDEPNAVERRSPFTEAEAQALNQDPPTNEEFLEVVAEHPEGIGDPSTAAKPPVVGRVYINQLLMTLFPHQNLPKSPNDPSTR